MNDSESVCCNYSILRWASSSSFVHFPTSRKENNGREKDLKKKRGTYLYLFICLLSLFYDDSIQKLSLSIPAAERETNVSSVFFIFNPSLQNV